jgi:TATA-binding protein-associated factor
MDTLWELLLDLDDLSPSTASVMKLLAELHPIRSSSATSSEEQAEEGKAKADEKQVVQALCPQAPCRLMEVIPRLWVFLRHLITSVRLSAMRTMQQLLTVSTTPSGSTLLWTVPLLNNALMLVFQSLLVETNLEVAASAEKVWQLLLVQCAPEVLAAAAATAAPSWFSLLATPAGKELNPLLVLVPPRCRRQANVTESDPNSTAAAFTMPTDDLRLTGATSARRRGSEALGLLAWMWPSETVDMTPMVAPLVQMSEASIALHRQLAANVLQHWLLPPAATILQGMAGGRTINLPFTRPPPSLLSHMGALLDQSQPPMYAELAQQYARMRKQGMALACHASQGGVGTPLVGLALEAGEGPGGTEEVVALATEVTMAFLSGAPMPSNATVVAARDQVLASAGAIQLAERQLHDGVLGAAAGATIASGEIPSKLNPLIRPLMSVIQRHSQPLIQQYAADALARLVLHCCQPGRKLGPIDKVVKNLCLLLCSDPACTPVVSPSDPWPPPLPADDDDLLQMDAPAAEGVSTSRGGGRPTTSGEQDTEPTDGFKARRGKQHMGSLMFSVRTPFRLTIIRVSDV